MSAAIRSWRKCPFTVGTYYVVLCSFQALRDNFAEGEVLQFEADAWSRYDGITGYFFRQRSSEELRVWDISDNDDISQWNQFFSEKTLL